MIPIGLVAAIVLLIVAADSWLESAGGRQRLESELTDRLGMPVRLGGEFSLSLFPQFGVAGTDLLIGSGDDRGEFARSGLYLLTLELAPLLDSEIEIVSLHLSGGRIDLENWPARDRPGERPKAPAGPKENKAPAPLPRIRHLELNDFDILFKRQGAEPGLRIKQLLADGLEEGAQAPLTLEFLIDPDGPRPVSVSSIMSLRLSDSGKRAAIGISDLTVGFGDTTIEGVTAQLEWSQYGPLLFKDLAWDESSFGQLAATGSVLFESPIRGGLEVDYIAPDSGARGRAELQFVSAGNVTSFPSIKLELAGQELGGHGCLLTAGEPSTQLTLQAEALDLDEIRGLIPASIPGGSESGDGSGFLDMDILLTVDRALVSGAIANGVEIRFGDSPECPSVVP